MTWERYWNECKAAKRNTSDTGTTKEGTSSFRNRTTKQRGSLSFQLRFGKRRPSNEICHRFRLVPIIERASHETYRRSRLVPKWNEIYRRFLCVPKRNDPAPSCIAVFGPFRLQSPVTSPAAKRNRNENRTAPERQQSHTGTTTERYRNDELRR